MPIKMRTVTLYPLDAVRNALTDRALEPALEEMRAEITRFPFNGEPGTTEEVLEAFDYARPRLNVLASLLAQSSGSGADISTGIGFLPVFFQHLGRDVVATEKDLSVSRFAGERGIAVLPYDIGYTRAPIEPASLEYVIFGEVLEHLRFSPVAVIRELSSLLRPGGRLLLTTPNIARLSHLEALAAGENFLEPFPELPMGADATEHIEHIREYSVREVVEALEGAGLGVEDVLMTGWGERGYAPLANPYANEIIVAVGRL